MYKINFDGKEYIIIDTNNDTIMGITKNKQDALELKKILEEIELELYIKS